MSPVPPPLPAVILEPIVRLALGEDLGRAGDLTTDATISPETKMRVVIAARKPGIVAGLDAAAHTLRLIDPAMALSIEKPDGSAVAPGDVIGRMDGSARSILTAERTMLNFLGRLSGVATLTRQYVDAVAHTKARIVCTRKTTPGHRALEKRAVRCGGGTSHRYGLDDAILIKDNHIAACGGSIADTLARAKAYAGHLRMIEIEVDTLEQLEEALKHGPHAVLLDNMSLETLRTAVSLTAGRVPLEASGGVTLSSVAAIAETGVDFISSGALTHSAPNLDVGLDVV
ncbi:MAG: nicotinate-nucleotide pyrophosphorylase [Hyphomonas sp. BRH_c22]|uniref:carboxylating nicotinate-nucleotide diphosphorylase n=1 Tax=Hyphomonas sp. BRH_c22 TaxID=1629710 RepID=UPI0005F12F8C|nr:carboxylating nicotinate-nucleotide diphosphorylase [Hyphomonas sp. BRH_c22]KJS38482.1 MAG: nicotinate-nucleotide pyrophosphorylase [Hyphomonas sp. BRH_c22]